MTCGATFLLCFKKKKHPSSKNTVVDAEIDAIETENLLVYKLQGGNEVNQVKKN